MITWELIALVNIVRDTCSTRVLSHHYFHITTEGWFILTNLDTLDLAIAAYKKRFDIEEMFRDFKSGGYNMEATNVAGFRLISLILLITIAYSSGTFNGQKIKSKGV